MSTRTPATNKRKRTSGQLPLDFTSFLLGKGIDLNDFKRELFVLNLLPPSSLRELHCIYVEELMKYLFIAAKLSEPEHDSDEDFSSAAPVKLVPIF